MSNATNKILHYNVTMTSVSGR